MALRINSTPAQAFNANFLLQGQAEAGSFSLSTPLGSTLAEVRWTPELAELRSANSTRHFTTLNALLEQATGTDLPVACLFNWLQGSACTAPDWQVDTSAIQDGRLRAQRLTPPSAQLTIVLER